MLSNVEVRQSPAPVNMAQAGSPSQTVEGSQAPQRESALRALEARLRRENLEIAYRTGLDVSPSQVWEAMRKENALAGVGEG